MYFLKSRLCRELVYSNGLAGTYEYTRFMRTQTYS
jgi:hypothetical protein